MSQRPEGIADQITRAKGQAGKPPIETWHPELSGDIDIVVARDGTWLYQDKPISREAIVRLFSTILRREADNEYYLVTPVEKWRIKVEDAPLIAHSLEVRGEGQDQQLILTTNVGEALTIGKHHPLRVGSYSGSDEPRPVIALDHGLEARLATSAFYDLAELIEEEQGVPGVWSEGNFFKMVEKS